MDQAEFDALTRARMRYLHVIQDSTRFDVALLCTMHHDWLCGIYSWAGKYRTVEMTKGGFRWPPAYLVSQNMTVFERSLLRDCTPCTPASISLVTERVARVHADFLLIHPFRDGNGRLARWLADLMIAQAALPYPKYGFEGAGGMAVRRKYLDAVKSGYARNYEPLRAFFAEAIERRFRDEV
jgi:cell filamentation protein